MIGSLALLLSSPASAATWSVCPDGSCDFAAIGDAVTAAADGDEILVHDGAYAESLVLEGRTLTISAADELSMPLLRGNGVDDALVVHGGVVTVAGIALLTAVGRPVTVDDGAELTLAFVSIRPSEPQLEGGAVRVDSASLTITESFLADGLAVRGGGLIYAVDAEVDVTDSLLEEGSARYGGAVWVSGASTVRLHETRISDSLGHYGGGVFVAGGVVELDSSELTGNWVNEYGGAIAVIGGRVRVLATQVHDNTSSTDGAGVYVGTDASATIEGSRLVDNVSANDGGAVYVAVGGSGTLIATRLHANHAGRYGGAVYAIGPVGSYQNDYCQNEAAGGGAVAVHHYDPENDEDEDVWGELASYNDVFNENVASYGGALEIGLATGRVTQATFVGNRAADEGAAMAFWLAEGFEVSRSIVAYHPAPAHGSPRPSLAIPADARLDLHENLFWAEPNGVPDVDGAGSIGDPMDRFEPGGDCNDYTWPAKIGAAARLQAAASGDPIDYDGTLADLGATGGVYANPAPWLNDNDDDGTPEIYDCDDSNRTTFPGAVEVWYDGVDADCDQASDFDQDRDGLDATDHGGDDCDDLDAAVHPGAPEIAGNSVDEDCDGIVADDGDGDGFSVAAGDCDDDDPNVNPNELDRDATVDRDCDDFVDVTQQLRPRTCSTRPGGLGGVIWLLALVTLAFRRQETR